MPNPNSTPLPEYIPPFGSDAPPRIYLVERLSEEELRRLETAAPAPELDETDLLDMPTAEAGLDALRQQQAISGDEQGAANDSEAASVRLVLFVSRTLSSQRMLRTARDLVARIGERRASVRVVDTADESAAAEIAEHRVTFTPTLLVETRDIRTRVVGAASLRALAPLFPELAGDAE